MLKTQSNYSVNELLRFLIRIKYIGQWFLLTYTIVDYGVYTSFGYHTFLRPISKSFLAIKDIIKTVLHANFQADWFEIVEKRSDSKSISDSGVWCNER